MLEQNENRFGICIEFRTKLWSQIFKFLIILMIEEFFPKILILFNFDLQ